MIKQTSLIQQGKQNIIEWQGKNIVPFENRNFQIVTYFFREF